LLASTALVVVGVVPGSACAGVVADRSSSSRRPVMAEEDGTATRKWFADDDAPPGVTEKRLGFVTAAVVTATLKARTTVVADGRGGSLQEVQRLPTARRRNIQQHRNGKATMTTLNDGEKKELRIGRNRRFGWTIQVLLLLFSRRIRFLFSGGKTASFAVRGEALEADMTGGVIHVVTFASDMG
jgi:hypothetical protein